MKAKLSSGVNLIVDRYAYSGVAYTAAKPGFDFEWCKQCDIGLPKPDLVCFMDTRMTDLETREAFGEERYEKAEFQRVVYNNFKKLFNLDHPASDCLVLNAKDTIQNIHNDILSSVTKLTQTSLSGLSCLW
jgi:dTMP kinase